MPTQIASRPLIAVLTTFFALVVLTVWSCTQEQSGGDHQTQKGDVHFGYEGEVGPEYWGTLKPEYALCGTGRKQSPIDITKPASADLPALTLNYHPTALKIINNGHAIQVNYDAGSSVQVNGIRYALKQFHFHSPSEHTVGGRHLPLEMHLVHKREAGGLAVVGVLFDQGADNEALAPVWAHLPGEVGEERSLPDVMLNVTDLLPDTASYYRYEGSLTTPPCSEEVKWLILTTPAQLSEGQMTAFQAVIKGNNRPTQPLNGREILERR